MHNTYDWIQAVSELLAAISDAGQIGVCTFAQGIPDIAICENPEYDDSQWEKILGKSAPIFGIDTSGGGARKNDTPYEVRDWNMTGGPAALRKRLSYPAEVEGISTENSKIFLTLSMLAPLQIFVDGRELANYRFWGDSRQCELTVCEQHQPGKTYTLVLKTPAGEGDAHLGIYVNCEALEEKQLLLTTALEQLRFTEKLAKLYGGEMADAMARIDAMLDPKAVLERNWPAIEAQLAKIDEILKPVDHYAKEFKVHLIAHAHIDMNWLWDYEDTVDVCVRDFRTVCDILDEYPDMRFSQSQAAVYDIVERHDPATFARVLEHIRQGHWEVTAATWTENDLNMTGGEGLIRDLYVAAEYVREKLKTTPSRVCWEPDTFGHPACTPNILVKAGVQYYYHFRNIPGHTLSWWEGTDGSRVLDFAFGPYNNLLRPVNLMPVVHELFDKYGLKTAMFVYGVGDHGGGPSRADIGVKHYLDTKPGLPRLVFSKVSDFFDEVMTQRRDFPVVRGEMNTIFEGCYTLKTKIKRYLRQGEARLLDAEAVRTYEALNGRPGKDLERIRSAWQDFGFLGFHDIGCGCTVVAADAHNYMRGARMMESAQQEIAEGFVPGDGQTISVFNQLAYARTELVEVDAPAGIAPCGFVQDASGKKTPYQTDNGKLYWIAENLPAFSSTQYTIVQEPCHTHAVKASIEGEIMTGGLAVLENARYRMEISRYTGTILRLYDKKRQAEVLERMDPYNEAPTCFCAHKSSNLLRITYEQPHIMTAWILGNEYAQRNLLDQPEIRLVSDGPVFARFAITHRYHDTKVEQFVTMYHPALNRIDFAVEADWQEFGNWEIGVPTLKVGMTSAMQHVQFQYETPFGSIIRNRHNSELPANRYVAMKGENGTLAMFNDCKFGFMAQGSSLFMTVVRGSYSPAAYPDRGIVTAQYAITPYYEDAADAQLTRDAASFNQRPIARLGAHLEAQGDVGIYAENDTVVISAVKPAFRRPNSMVVRCVEYAGRALDCSVHVPENVKAAYLADALENALSPLPVNDGTVTVRLKGHEVKSILLEY